MNNPLENRKHRYFHVTPKINLESIRSKGLLAQIGERSFGVESVKRVFFFPNTEEMDNALLNWFGELFEETEDLIILQVDLPEEFPIVRELDSNGELFFEAYCNCDVPKEYISSIYDEEYNQIT